MSSKKCDDKVKKDKKKKYNNHLEFNLSDYERCCKNFWKTNDELFWEDVNEYIKEERGDKKIVNAEERIAINNKVNEYEAIFSRNKKPVKKGEEHVVYFDFME